MTHELESFISSDTYRVKRRGEKPLRHGEEVVGSDAFRIEYGHHISDAAIRDDIISYLGEYRFQLPTYSYEFSLDTKGHIAEIRDGELMVIKAKRAIERRREQGKSTYREEAELSGFLNLEAQLQYAQLKNTICWASPPGDKEDGYGSYGFFFVGKVGEGKIAMTAIRVEDPTLEQYNKAMTFITGESNHKAIAEEFLESPVVVPQDISDQFIDKVLSYFFSLRKAPDAEEVFDLACRRLDPLIQRLIPVIRAGTKQERTLAFHTIENIALRLKEGKGMFIAETDNYQNASSSHMRAFVRSYGYKPPIAAGSCGSTQKKEERVSSNIFSFNFGFLGNFFGEESDEDGTLWPICPSCGEKNKRERNEFVEKCSHCGSTKIACK